MTYRVGHHSTSDDSTRYRTKEEINYWTVHNNPRDRLKSYIQKKGWWSPEEDEELKKNARQEILAQLRISEHKPKPPLEELFTDVYDTMPQHLKEQYEELKAHIAQNPEHYKTGH